MVNRAHARKFCLSVVSAFLIAQTFTGVLSAPAFAGQISEVISFEEALEQSALVVLGKIVKTPEYGVEDSAFGVRTDHLLFVERYLKGEGPEYLTLSTQGGLFWRATPEGRKLYEGRSSIATWIPGEGESALFFLRNASGHWVFSTGTHGVVQVQTDSEGKRSVTLLFKRPSAMPPATREGYERGLERGAKPGQFPYLGTVPVSWLKDLIHRVLNP